MRIAYIDECGFALNWQESIKDQPFYVLAAALFDMVRVQEMFSSLQAEIERIRLKEISGTLGRGMEIKARDVDAGSGYWSLHPEHRAKVRKIMLSAPAKYGGTVFIVIINKQLHFEQYVTPEDPSLLALQFLLERIQIPLQREDDRVICVCDQNRSYEPKIVEAVESLAAEGSMIFYHSRVLDQFVQKRISFPEILEFHFGQSQNSVGLQIADFIARVTYSWRKRDKVDTYPGWSDIHESLYRNEEGKLEGFGYKEFPLR